MSDGNLCARCGLVIHVKDSVEMTSRGWMHARCVPLALAADLADPDNDEYEGAGDVVVLERPGGTRERQPSVDPHTSESLVTLLVRMLQVPPMGGENHTQWIAGRAANIAQAVTVMYGGHCPTCGGCVPLVELHDETEPMAAVGTKGG